MCPNSPCSIFLGGIPNFGLHSIGVSMSVMVVLVVAVVVVAVAMLITMMRMRARKPGLQWKLLYSSALYLCLDLDRCCAKK